MTEQEIITGLKNAVERGEPLNIAVQSMINAGYDSKKIHEASQFINSGTLSKTEPVKKQELAFPEQKKPSFFKNKKFIILAVILIVLLIILGTLLILKYVF